MLQTTSNGDHSPVKNLSETEESCLTKYRTGHGINDVTDELNIAVTRDAATEGETFGFAPISPHCHYHSPLKIGENGEIQNDGKKLRSQISKLTNEVVSGNLSRLVIVVFGTGHLETELALLKLDNFNNQKAKPAEKLLNHVCKDADETIKVAGLKKDTLTEFTIARLTEEENATAAAITAHISELRLGKEYSDKIEVYTWEKFKAAHHSAFLDSQKTRDELLQPNREQSNGREAEQEGETSTLEKQVSHTAENYLHGLAGGSTKTRNIKGNRKKGSTKGDSGLRAKLVQELYTSAESAADTNLQTAYRQTIAAIEDDIQTYIRNELVLFIMFKVAFGNPVDRHLVFYPGAANHAVRHTCSELTMNYVHLNISARNIPAKVAGTTAQTNIEDNRQIVAPGHNMSLLNANMEMQLQVMDKIANIRKDQLLWLSDKADTQVLKTAVSYLKEFSKKIRKQCCIACADEIPSGIEDLESSNNDEIPSGIEDLESSNNRESDKDNSTTCDLIASIGAVLYASTQAALDLDNKENTTTAKSTLSEQLQLNSAKFCCEVAQEYKKILESGQRELREADKQTLQTMQQQIKELFGSTLEKSVQHAKSLSTNSSAKTSMQFKDELVSMLEQCDAILERASSLRRSSSLTNLPASIPVATSVNLSTTGVFAKKNNAANLSEEQPVATTSNDLLTSAH